MRHFAFTDIHGMEKLFDKVISEIEAKSNEEEYHIYFLGDAADRGAKGYKIMKKLLDNPKITYLYGNHEDMFVKAAKDINATATSFGIEIRDLYEEYILCNNSQIESVNLCLFNGGFPTIREWVKDSASRRTWIVNQIQNLPRYATYNNYDMCHAGCFQKDWKNDEHEMLWCRKHFNEEWFNGRILVHGHTPVSSPNIVYANNTKINLDSGACRTGFSRVLDMDNKELFYVTL